MRMVLPLSAAVTTNTSTDESSWVSLAVAQSDDESTVAMLSTAADTTATTWARPYLSLQSMRPN